MSPASLPEHDYLPVRYLVTTLNDVTNSYKFFWFLAILEAVAQGVQGALAIEVLLSKMVAHVWYPVNYFRLSLGHADQLAHVVQSWKNDAGLAESESRGNVEEVISNRLLDNLRRGHKGECEKKLYDLTRYVPYRLLSPWFADELRGVKDALKNRTIAELSLKNFQTKQKAPIYTFNEKLDEIILHPEWVWYLQTNMEIIRGFVYWKLIGFLQKRNPSVPNLAAKLFRPEKRDLSRANRFWQMVIDQKRQTGKELVCIYSGSVIEKANLSLDHFLPWSFVCHDQLWNITPTIQAVNSSKSNSLPALEYLKPFAAQQYDSLQSVLQSGSGRMFDDYIELFKVDQPRQLQTMSYDRFLKITSEALRPQFQIARSMGFSDGWKWAG